MNITRIARDFIALPPEALPRVIPPRQEKEGADMKYIATDPNETAIYALGDSPEDAIRAANDAAGVPDGVYETTDGDVRLEWDTYPATPALVALVMARGGAVSWRYTADGTACTVAEAQQADSSEPPEGYTLHDLPGEEVIHTYTGRWQYMSIHYRRGKTFQHRYFHLDCDAICDGTGRCMMCHAKPFPE